MTREVRYSKEDFIKSFPHTKEIAEKYCTENPKDDYGSEDYRAMYYLTPEIVASGRPVGSGRWDEEMVNDDRLISIYMRDMYGE